MNLIYIIIIIVILIILTISIIYIILNNKSNVKTSGADYKALFDLGVKLSDSSADNSEILNKNYRQYNDKHINFINNVCKYINETGIEINDSSNSLIVGDVHGSILQLFMPLKQAKILNTISFNPENKTFTYYLTNLAESNQVIYCGDFFGRAKHPLTVELISTFIDIYNEVNKLNEDKIVWVFGNHDVGFIKTYCYNLPTLTSGIFKIEVKDIVESANFKNLIEKLKNLVDNNKYPCIYVNHNSKIIVSHTLIPYEEIENDDDETLYNSIEYAYNYSLLQNPDKSFKKLTFDEQINCINDIATQNIKVKSRFGILIEKTLYWSKPFEYKNKEYIFNIDDKNINQYKYFIGHTILHNIKTMAEKHIDINFNTEIEFNKAINEFIMEFKNLKFKDISIIKLFDNIYPIDFDATSGISDYLSELKQNTYLKKINIENGFNMSLFIIHDKNNNTIKLSKLYLI